MKHHLSSPLLSSSPPSSFDSPGHTRQQVGRYGALGTDAAETRPDSGGQQRGGPDKGAGPPPAELRSGEQLERHGWRSRTWALAGVPVRVQV